MEYAKCRDSLSTVGGERQGEQRSQLCEETAAMRRGPLVLKGPQKEKGS